MRTNADLSALTRARTNGLCAASDGTLYVTSTCSDLQGGQERASGNIIRVAMDGTATIICDEDLMFPNGVALIADEKCLLIAETFGERVTILDLGTGRRRAVTAPGTYPDGICAAPGDTRAWPQPPSELAPAKKLRSSGGNREGLRPRLRDIPHGRPSPTAWSAGAASTRSARGHRWPRLPLALPGRASV
jgi:hypothetical protein